MLKRLLLVLASASLLFSTPLHAAKQSRHRHGVADGKLPAVQHGEERQELRQDENINGIAADIVREMFKRADITYSLTLRFPWERVYKQAWKTPDTARS
jgi:polar amino acid transport system substrate-binding protein